MKSFDFDNDISENILSCPYISYAANERLQLVRDNQILRTAFKKFSFPCQNTLLKSAPQNLNLVMAKARSKSCTLDCS